MTFFPVYIDAIIFRFNKNKLEVRLAKRSEEDPRLPGRIALEGILIQPDLDINEEEALKRLFKEKVKLKPTYTEQLHCFSNATRDISGYSMCIPYLCLVESTAKDTVGDWHNVVDLLKNRDDYLPFDHMKLIRMGYDALFYKSGYTNLPMMLLEQPFKFSDVRKVFETTTKKPQHRGGLQNRMLPLLTVVDEGKSNKRDSKLYKRNNNTVVFFKNVSEGLN